MQRVKVQLYTGNTHTHADLNKPSTCSWLLTELLLTQGTPLNGGTRVSPSLIIPLTPACQVRSPLFSCFLIKMKLLYFLFCPMCSLSHFPLPYFFPLLYLLSPCHPGCAAVCVPGFPSPLTHHVGQGPTVFFPHLDRDFNHEGRWPNDGPTLPPVTVFVFPSVCLSFTVTTRTMVPSVHRIINMPPPLYLSCWAHNEGLF